MSVQEGLQEKALGIGRVTAGEEEHNPGWLDAAELALHDCAAANALVHVDVLKKSFTSEPRHHNCWGAVWQRGIKNGWLQRTGERHICEDKRKHARAVPVYKSLLFVG